MNRLKIILKEDHTLHELMVGITAVNLILAAATFFATDRQKALCAVAIGFVCAILYVIHMAVTIDDALWLDEKGAITETRKQMVIRYLFVCVIVGVSLYFKAADPVFLVLSVISIKAGAYIQPLVHKIFCRRTDN